MLKYTYKFLRQKDRMEMCIPYATSFFFNFQLLGAKCFQEIFYFQGQSS